MIPFEEIKPKIKDLAEKYHLSLVVLFGSQATGKTHSLSDVDFAFINEKVLSPADMAKMQVEFSERLKIKNLEMVGLKGAHPFLLKQVAQKSVLLYENEPSLFSKFKIYAFKRFIEAKNLFDLKKLSLDRFLQKI